jgi:hypothetical protein
VGFDEEKKTMARNPFGHALQEDAQEQIAAVVGYKGAERIFESMDARLPIEEMANPMTQPPLKPGEYTAFEPTHKVKVVMNNDGSFTAMTRAASKDFKTYKAALAWLQKNASGVMSKWEEDEPTGPVLDERQMEQGVRYEIVNVQPGDFGGIAKHQGELAVKVMGNTFAIKDELKKLGFRFNRDDKTWELKHEYTSFGKARGAKRDTVEAAIKKIGPIVKATNDEIQKRNQAALAGAGISDDPKATTTKGQVKAIMSLQRANERLKSNGIAITYDFPHSIGGFAKGGAYTVWVVGDTFKVKDELKRLGFQFHRVAPSDIKVPGIKVQAGWSMDGATFDRIDKQVKQTLIRASEGTLREDEDLLEGWWKAVFGNGNIFFEAGSQPHADSIARKWGKDNDMGNPDKVMKAERPKAMDQKGAFVKNGAVYVEQ